MNKATLALRISERLNINKKDAEDMIASLQDIIIEALKRDEEVTIAGFGTFSARMRHARKGVNPRKPDQMIDVPAVKVPKFKAGKRLKDELKASLASTTPTSNPVTAAPTV
ncbi:MAG: DNA-binding protein HU [Candidatus Uhrbacteria bacterium GW2011_GWD2_41_121]|uniref:DNA-binding protein HU n=1 Tax=Candidatus Uhrbacteria bacterium GW2011_GWC1_41_20 TaxID=1618983 RepID=A0A0G0XPC5_9BACT|nr:MAG: DNA-binding protein HU [Candidatus Uhrbacteria bacterium GW2011_GWE1_39_46]KKR89856.1 MAG: DNA-binding protein HU [Candidatus Uhrbacteria bacterium GW2011_GWD2_41_121]KKR95709.1 MAG: DNA-binding protein HU [Candidatus Uhrbacteria bacterium GW2011_GWD1_41_16]KKR98645.1 MAG: DNA-binding protein HU [Candidatus Uhrbacteria bacterium GW2011_GWC1_41_20]KKS05714.1 MAG: DNA-binding protein HU [Candidatus Uhrbacteria bacterium GW2011_GWB2_41_36]KKS07589.1 MAG: DNA-binding protein HU [Candidatus